MAVRHTFKWKHGLRTEELTATRAIRMKCYDCMGWEVGVERLIKECEIRDCALWPFRLGKNPSKKRHISEEKREEIKKQMEDLRKKRRSLREGPMQIQSV